MTGLFGLLLSVLGQGQGAIERAREREGWSVAGGMSRQSRYTGVDAEVRIGAKVNSSPKLTLPGLLYRDQSTIWANGWTRWRHRMRGGVLCGGLVGDVCMLPSQATDALDKNGSCPSIASSRLHRLHQALIHATH